MSYVNVAIVGMQAFNQVQGGKLARQQGNVQGDWLDYQAEIENDAALQTARIIRRAGKATAGSARASAAALGLKVDEGSAADIQEQVIRDSEMDAFQALLEGHRRGRGLQVDAASARAGVQSARAASNVQATNTILGGSYQAMRSNGWRTNGPGFSGTQSPAPVYNRFSPDAILLTQRGSGD